jgi:hypothetical protein
MILEHAALNLSVSKMEARDFPVSVGVAGGPTSPTRFNTTAVLGENLVKYAWRYSLSELSVICEL